MALALAGLGGVATWTGEHRRAAHILGDAQAAIGKLGREIFLADTVDTLGYPLEQMEYERDLAHLQEQLDPAIFSFEWDKGRLMSPERAFLEAYRIKPPG